MPQAAFDVDRPNGSARRALGDRVIHVYRLYRRQGPAGLRALSAESSLPEKLRQKVRSARGFLQDLQEKLAPSQGFLAGRVLVKEFRFVLVLDRIEDIPEVRTHFSYVRNGYFIDTPFRNAKGVTRFRVSGRTHWTPVMVNGVPVDGDAALKEFKELVDDYFFPPTGAPPSDFELVWLNLNAPVSAEDPFGEFEWLIHPVQHGIRSFQSAQRPFQRFFQFEFLGLESNRDRAKAEDGFLAGLLSGGVLRRLLENVGLDALADGIDTVFGTVEEFQGLVDDVENIATAVNDYIRGAQDFIRASIAKVRGVLTGIDALVSRIEEGVELVKDFPDLTEAELGRLAQEWPGLTSGDPTPAVLAAAQARRLRDFLLALSAQPQNFIPAGPSEAAQPPQTLALQITPGTTLARLARDTNVEPTLLIELNDLRYPFVDSRPRPERQLSAAQDGLEEAEAALGAAVAAGETQAVITARQQAVTEAQVEVQKWTDLAATSPALPHVLYAGDFVRVPQARREQVPSIVGVTGAQTFANGQTATEEERLFGIDLLLNDDGDLEWDEPGRDLKVSRGLQNIVRAQVRYLRLPLGGLRFAPGIGNFAFADLASWQGPGRNRLLAYSIWRTLDQDPRIREVRNVRAETHRGVANLRYDATLINGQSFPDLRLPVGGL